MNNIPLPCLSHIAVLSILHYPYKKLLPRKNKNIIHFALFFRLVAVSLTLQGTAMRSTVAVPCKETATKREDCWLTNTINF